MKLVAFDIGGTSIKVGHFIEDKLVDKSSFETPQTFEEMVSSMKGYITEDIEGVAISAPGVVDSDERTIKNYSAVPYIHHRPIFDELEAAFHLPVTIENDANCAGICEMALGAGKPFKNAGFIVLGTGIGGSVFIDGKLYKGGHLFGGEFGFSTADNDATLNDSYTFVKGVEAYQRENPNADVKNGQQLFAAAENHDPLAESIINKIYDQVSNMMYNLQVAFDFDAFILGGGVSAREELPDQIKTRVNKLLHKNLAYDIAPQIIRCQYKNDANLYGAVVNFLNLRE